MIEVRHLETLDAVVRNGSMAAAARVLGYTQSAVSQQIAELERRVGLRVLERRPLRATEAGNVLLNTAEKISGLLAAATIELNALRSGQSGQVRLAAFASAGGRIVPAAIARLRETSPGVNVTLTQLEPDASYAGLMRGDLDLAVTFEYDKTPLPPPPPLRRTLLARDPVYVALPAGHPLTFHESIDLARLAGEAWIAAAQTCLPLDLLAEVTRTAGFIPSVRFEGDDFQTTLSLVAHGLGVAVLPRLALGHPPAGVVTRPLTGSPLTRLLYATRLDTRHLPRAIDALESALAEITAAELTT